VRKIDWNGDVVGLDPEFVMDQVAREYEQGSERVASPPNPSNQLGSPCVRPLNFVLSGKNHESGYGERQQACLARQCSVCASPPP
jgi:hypothetical protein